MVWSKLQTLPEANDKKKSAHVQEEHDKDQIGGKCRWFMHQTRVQ